MIGAFKQGEALEGIVRSYRTLRLADVYAVISRCLANLTPFDGYLRRCDEQAEVVRRRIKASQRPGANKEELLARRQGKGINPVNSFLVDRNFILAQQVPRPMTSVESTKSNAHDSVDGARIRPAATRPSPQSVPSSIR